MHASLSRTFATGLRWGLVAALAASVQPLGGQELPLKRELPGEASLRCPPAAERPPEPAPEERAQADRLGSTAAQAVILGDTERARDLLARATQLDPSSPELAYQYGRTLESLDDASGALAQYCRVLDLDPDWSDADEVRARIDAVAVEGAPSSIAPEALVRFQEGVDQGVVGRLEESLQSFRDAASAAPAWPDPVYNQGVVLLRLGQRDDAVDALSRYLVMSPLAPDAIVVSQRLGQLQVPGSRPSPGAALTLGLIFPGMGQFYSGRPGTGFTFLALAGGAAAAGWFVEEVQVRCLLPVPPGEECPEEFVQSRTTEQPYLVAGLVAAGAITLVGAVEAWINARGRRRSDGAGLVSIDLGRARLSGFAVASHGGSVDLDWIRLSF